MDLHVYACLSRHRRPRDPQGDRGNFDRVSNCLHYEACTIPTDDLGTEEYLAKIDGSHTIVFSVTYGFPRGLVYITSRLLNAKFKR